MSHKTKPDILVLWGVFPPDIGGGATWGYRLFKALSERGYDITVFVNKPPGAKICEKFSPNFQVVRVPPAFAYPLKPGHLWRVLRLLSAIARYVNLYPLLALYHLKHKPVVIIKESPTWYFGPKFISRFKLGFSGLAPWILLKRMVKAPLLIYFTSFFHWPKYYVKSSAYGADGIIIDDRYMEIGLKELGIEKEIFYLPDSLDLSSFSASAIPENNTVLFVGRLSKERGCDTLMKAAPEIIQRVPDCKIVVVGDGAEMANLKEMAREYGIESHLTFIGVVNPLEIGMVYHNARVMVDPVRVPAIGNATTEALASGVPVVHSVIEGYPGYPIEDGKNGYLFKVDDHLDLANKVINVLEAGNWQELSRAARETAREFDLSPNIDKLEEIILQFLR